MALTLLQERFVDIYCANIETGLSAGEVALRAGYSPKTAHQAGPRLLGDIEIQKLIQARRTEVMRNCDVATMREAVDILRHYVQLVTADPTKVQRIRHLCCRHCHGVDFAYQWIEQDWVFEVAQAAQNGDAMPGCEGGFGFKFNEPPNPDCPHCRGEGIRDHYIEDFDRLGPAERRLIAGVKQTKDGWEVKYRDQDGALKILAQIAGLLIEKKEHTGPNGGPIQTANLNVALPSDPVEAAALYSKIMGG